MGSHDCFVFRFPRPVLQQPGLMVTVVLTLGVILVNGWTDAPSAIATCVSARAIGPGPRF